MAKQSLQVEGMTCPNCGLRIEGLEDSLAGVQVVMASYRLGRVVVEYDEKKVALGAIVEAIRNMGYEVVGEE